MNVVVFATTTSLFKGVRGQIYAIETGIGNQVESNHKKVLEAIEDGLISTQLTTLIWFLLQRSTWTSANQKLPLRQLWHVVYVFVFVDTNLLFS